MTQRQRRHVMYALFTTAATMVTVAAMASAGAAATSATPRGSVPLVTDPASLVNPLIGTGNQIPPSPSGGVNTFPGPDVPFGMLQWSPDTSPDRQAGGGYYYGDNQIMGYSLSHLSGPGCGAAGDVPILPTTGAIPTNPTATTATFSHSGESASADYYSLVAGGVKTELTEALRSGIGRFTFPATTQANLLLKLADSQTTDTATSATVISPTEVQGSVSTGGFCGGGNKYTLYFDITFDHPIAGSGTWKGTTVTPGAKSLSVRGSASRTSSAKPTPQASSSQQVQPSVSPSPSPASGGKAPSGRPRAAASKIGAPVYHGKVAPTAAVTPNGLYLTFNTTSSQVLQAKVGISYVSAANAALNATTEQSGWNFDAVHQAGVTAWNNELGKIQIGGGSTSHQTVFYTALYHSLLHPNVFSDVNGQYTGFDNQVHTIQAGHIQVANYSGWDTYRSQGQLEAIVDPAMASNAAQSMVNDAAQNNGMLPKWAMNNGESYVMVGDPADGLLGGYYAFGARNFDTASALKYALAEANTPNNIRPGLNYYESLGYEPSDGSYGCCNFYGTVATTLEYAQADYALSNFARALGDSANANKLLARSQNWQNLYNPQTGYLQPRTMSGAWVPVTPTTQNNYVEGDASQYRWQVGWNLAGLFNAMGGSTAVNSQLDKFWTKLNEGSGSPYSFWDNQFEYYDPWEYNWTGEPWKTQALVSRIRNQLYLNNPVGEGDNDDLGATASMGVFSMLGFDPVYMSTQDVTLNSPEFPMEVIHLSNGHTLTISAPKAGGSNIYIQSMTVNGSAWNKTWLPDHLFSTGAQITMNLGSTPNKSWGTSASSAPPSHSYGEASAIGFFPQQQVTIAPGASTTVKIGVQDVTGHNQTVSASLTAPSGLTVSPASGSVSVPAAGKGYLSVKVSASSSATQTFYTVPVKLTAGGVALKPLSLTVLVAKPGSLLSTFNNAGISDDSNVTAGNFDGGGASYSTQALAAQGIKPGSTFTANGISYTWPLPSAGYPDNTMASGQTVKVNAPAGTQQVDFLGSGTNGGAQGAVTLTYSDGSTRQYELGLSDWTLGGGGGSVLYGNQTAATTAYRNCSYCNPVQQAVKTYLFTAAIPVDSSKTLVSVKLPSNVMGGALHVFAIGSSTTAMSGAVLTSVSPAAAAAGDKVTITGSGFGATQGSGYVAFSDEGTNWGAPGNTGTFTVDSWSNTSITFTVPTPSGTMHVWPGTQATVSVTNGSGQTSDTGLVSVKPTSSMSDYYNNTGTSPDNNQACANLDGDGYSLSANALATAGVTPGSTVTAGGVSLTWPNVAACSPDNVLAAGQTILLPSHPGASKLGILANSTNGDSSGTVTITYTDGTSTTVPLNVTDWAGSPSAPEVTAVTIPYRNSGSGTSQSLTVSVWEISIPVNSSKTVSSVTLPSVSFTVNSSTTGMHIYALGLS